jgi:predicted metal-dependent phosphoesterase TrpH
MDEEVRVDLHCHTSASYDGKIDPVQLALLARDRGLTHIAITDHEAINGALAARDAAIEGITVIVGEEVRTSEGDLILLYVKELIPAGLSPEETVRLAREQGCLVGLAHPFDFHRPSIGRGAATEEQLRRLANFADYVEVDNGRVRDCAANGRAADFARSHNLPQVAVSDAHQERDIGLTATLLERDIKTAGNLKSALDLRPFFRVREARFAESARNTGALGRLRRVFRRTD